MGSGLAVLVVSAILLSAPSAYCANRVLFVDSYHAGYVLEDYIERYVKTFAKLKMPKRFIENCIEGHRVIRHGQNGFWPATAMPVL